MQESTPGASPVIRMAPTGSLTYAASSRLESPGLAPAVTLLQRAAEAVPLPAPRQQIVIADYGAATGHNSLTPIGAAIAVIRQRTRPEHAILVAHNDVPENDFTALFQTLAGDPQSYLHQDTASFASAIGRSFYSQILPSKSVTLGWTSWATQWLSTIPTAALDAAGHIQLADSSDGDTARVAYSRQAAQDWQNFLASRGRELRTGGRLVVLTTALGANGQWGYRPLHDAVVATLHDQIRDGLLSSDELRRMTIPTFARTEQEFRAPFAPRGRFEGLTIEHFELFDSEDRFWARFQADRDAAAFGIQWAAFLRASVFPALAGALDHGHRDPRAAEFVEQLEATVAARLSSAPEPMQIRLASMVLVKQKR